MPRPILRVLSATACAALIGTTATATTATATEQAAPSETANCATLQGAKIPAKRIGLRAGNPETLKLFKTCSNCPVRGANQ